jgi:hypothetical protein
MESSVSRVIGYVENRLAIEGKSADSDSEPRCQFPCKIERTVSYFIIRQTVKNNSGVGNPAALV